MHAINEPLIEQLLHHLCSLGIEISEDSAEKEIKYLRYLLLMNETMNLTSVRNEDDAVVLHLADSLTILHEFDTYRIKSFLDIGSGGGLPAIPVLIGRDCIRGILTESIQKKANALKQFCDYLSIQDRVVIEDKRIEEIGMKDTYRNSLQCVTARAVAKANVLIEYAAPLLKMDGVLILMKGTPEDSEFEDAQRAASICGLKEDSIRRFELPESYGKRTILVYRKIDKPKIKLPRRIGLAKSNPL